jgi:rhamnulokinase
MLMIPDLLGFWLTGEQIGERTNAFTTGLLEIGSGILNATLIDKLSLPRSLFPFLVDPGPAARRRSSRSQVRLWT